ncbi:MAG: hypothetical protein ACYDHH_04630 [Solirubrobacteraceae bacterium]
MPFELAESCTDPKHEAGPLQVIGSEVVRRDRLIDSARLFAETVDR